MALQYDVEDLWQGLGPFNSLRMVWGREGYSAACGPWMGLYKLLSQAWEEYRPTALSFTCVVLLVYNKLWLLALFCCRCLILAPTRELAKQVAAEFESICPSLTVVSFYGGTSINAQVLTGLTGRHAVLGIKTKSTTPCQHGGNMHADVRL